MFENMVANWKHFIGGWGFRPKNQVNSETIPKLEQHSSIRVPPILTKLPDWSPNFAMFRYHPKGHLCQILGF